MKALKTLNPYFWKHRVLLFWGFLFIILSNFFTIYKVQFVGQTINIIEGNYDKLKLSNEVSLIDNVKANWSYFRIIFINSGILLVCSLLSGFFTFMMRQTIIVASRRIEYELKNKIFRHYEDLSLTDYKKTTIGDLMNRLSEDVVAIRMYLGPGVMYVVNLAILLIITSTYMLMTDVEMTFWTLIPLPILS
ncbi:MAG: ABC transporter transmembrane domain-containing protein, partial [Soonwooa sp.]